MEIITSSLFLCAALLISGAAQSSLIDRGGGLIYDTDLNITWLQDANYAAGSSYDLADGHNDGRMTWQNSMDWAANLSYYDSVRKVAYSDWRLPTTLQPDASCGNQDIGLSHGFGCTGGEMGHLYYVALNGNINTSPFVNIFSDSTHYWSSTEDPRSASTSFSALQFYFLNGDQRVGGKSDWTHTGWAVRNGDVAAVPVPAAAWLFGSGLLGLVSVARRKAA